MVFEVPDLKDAEIERLKQDVEYWKSITTSQLAENLNAEIAKLRAIIEETAVAIDKAGHKWWGRQLRRRAREATNPE